ncbi:DUF6527 family protein [Methylococcus mesophilus]|uniref:DUF6527 family protein n=1 Tax=Methylococcus mesophilus TaxID=2993564 RepID=UPI003744137E
MKKSALSHQFVEYVPERLQEGILYISIPYATAAHSCCCGCGKEVATPLSPTDWRLTFDGETVSLEPSIGNWSFPCRSHYWIKRSKVAWAAEWSQQAVEAGRACDRAAKLRYYDSKDSSVDVVSDSQLTLGTRPTSSTPRSGEGFLTMFKRWLLG